MDISLSGALTKHRSYSNANTRFQSFFMLMTVQPLCPEGAMNSAYSHGITPDSSVQPLMSPEPKNLPGLLPQLP